MQNIELIAEAGVNYYDYGEPPMEAAKRMIRDAAFIGIETIKFQTYKAHKLAARESPAYWDRNEEATDSQRKLFEKYDKFGEEEYTELADYCNALGIEFMSTAFDVDSAIMIDKLVTRHKVASADITNIELLRAIQAFRKPVIISTGEATLDEIDAVVDMFEDVTLLHCVLLYPTRPEQAGLHRIDFLRRRYPGCRIGYSDHTKYNRDILTTAWLLGAEVIEKHYTLDKTLKGNDHYHAADTNDFFDLMGQMDTLRGYIGAKSEPNERIRKLVRRGVYLKRDVFAGEFARDADVDFLRPLNNGITPEQWYRAAGTYSRDMKVGTLIKKGDVIW